MNIRILCLTLVAVVLRSVSFADTPGPRPPVVRSYRAEVRPDVVAKTIAGRTEMTLDRGNDAREAVFSTNGLTIDAVSVDGAAAAFTADEASLRVRLPDTGKATVTLAVDYHGTPARGLVFGDGFVYSAFFTCHWMICDEDPGARASVQLEVVVPADFAVVASGEAVEQRREPPNHVRHVWRQDRPDASYLYGFAAGRFHEALERKGNVVLRFLGARDDPAALRRKLGVTADMMAFFEEVAGVPFPHAAYTQVVVPNDVAQEMSSFSVVGNEALDPIVDNPREDWVVAHELAHQWWGNSLTCRTWRDFWLNEGMTVFLVAAWKERKWGRPDYERELELCRQRWQRAKDEDFDKPLRYDGPYPSLRIKRAIVYSKGALFLDALRTHVGDAGFWAGLRAYTTAHAGRSVETADFRRAMEDAAGRDLSDLFARWVE